MPSETNAEKTEADPQAMQELLSSAEIKELLQLYIAGVFPGAIYVLVSQGLLDKDRLSDGEYVLTELLNHLDLLEDYPFGTQIELEFVESAKDVLASNRPTVAIVLLAAAVEQRVNIFYREVLGFTTSLKVGEITEVIRANSLFSKLGWLLAITSGYEIDGELKKRVLELMELRNQIIHFKGVPSKGIDDDESGSYNQVMRQIKGLNMNDLCALPDQLDKELSEIEEALLEEHLPEFKQVKETIQPWMEKFKQSIASPKPSSST